MAQKQECFIIAPIGEDGSDTRKRSDQILKHIITPAVTACGFEPVRADKISEPGMITSQVIQHIIDDPLVLADLTGMNPNVFYELAIRHAIRKPLVQIIQKGEKIPFDIAGMRTISVDHRDLDSVDESKQEIQKQIRAIIGKKPEEVESPISISLELQTLRHSENPEERSFAELISAISDLRSDITGIEKRISSPENLIPPNYLKQFFDLPYRKRTREMEMMFEESIYRLKKLASMKGPKGATEEFGMELDRLEHMLFMLRKEM